LKIMNEKIISLNELTKPVDGTESREVVVFIHGICSSHETFEELASNLRRKGLGTNVIFAYHDYNFRKSIAESGMELAMALEAAFGESDLVTIVGHSMGGLVSRLALLQRGTSLPFVRRLIMLGTPNHGTLHTAKLGILANLTREATGRVWALVTRRTGIKELTEIHKLLEAHLSDDTQTATFAVEYITIPATCFNENAGLLAHLKSKAGRKMGVLPLAFDLISQAHPAWRIGLEMPHDGIVEESSVYLGNRGGVNRRSERLATCRGSSRGGPYLHVRHRDFDRESHVTIQKAERTARILYEILTSPTLRDWKDAKESSVEYDFEP
jgi:pimeloyl-ACP methyl ester carboxylesterase